METKNFDERTYAERVTDIYKRVKANLGEEKAKDYNEVIRGASLLEGEDHKVTNAVDRVSDENLETVVNHFLQATERLKEQYDVKSVHELFEIIKEYGKSKLFLWNGQRYQAVEVPEVEKDILPWGGVIRSGGPKQEVSVLGVTQDYEISLSDDSIIINGHKFDKMLPDDPNVRYVDQVLAPIENDTWDGRKWEGKWVQARYKNGRPKRGGPFSQMIMEKVI